MIAPLTLWRTVLKGLKNTILKLWNTDREIHAHHFITWQVLRAFSKILHLKAHDIIFDSEKLKICKPSASNGRVKTV